MPRRLRSQHSLRCRPLQFREHLGELVIGNDERVQFPLVPRGDGLRRVEEFRSARIQDEALVVPSDHGIAPAMRRGFSDDGPPKNSKRIAVLLKREMDLLRGVSGDADRSEPNRDHGEAIDGFWEAPAGFGQAGGEEQAERWNDWKNSIDSFRRNAGQDE